MTTMPLWKQYYVGAAVVAALGVILLFSPDVGVWPLWAMGCLIVACIVGLFGWMTWRKAQAKPPA